MSDIIAFVTVLFGVLYMVASWLAGALIIIGVPVGLVCGVIRIVRGPEEI